MVSVQRLPFFQPSFLGNKGKENVFYYNLERKNAFLGYKNKKFKKWKNWQFSKGVNRRFWSKNGYFWNFFFLRNKALLGYKNKTFKKSKNWHFSKRVNRWFWSKNCHLFQPSFLGNIEKKNVFYYNQERENAFLGYKNKKFKKSNNWHFSKPVNPWFWSKNAHFSNFFFSQ